MKKITLHLACFLTLLLSGCSTSKNTTIAPTNETWELDFITGPRIAFNGLYPDKKPQITFQTEKKEVNGNSSCNTFTAKYTLKRSTIKFDENFPMTMMFCEGEGEPVFIKTLKEVNNYFIDKEGNLYMKKDDLLMMRFKKINK